MALVSVLAIVVVNNAPGWNARYEAWAAARSLRDGDLDALEERLTSNRGNLDFAYHFASQVTPRDLGDALATVAGTDDTPLKPGIDPYEYELLLTDLAGVLALATHGTGDRALPRQWTKDFITATTKPSDLYKVEGSIKDSIPFHKTDAEKRRDQDVANRSNLLLLLARGYWSFEFVQSVTTRYYDFDRENGDDAWPEAEPDDDVGYAPAPNGVYLTDGVLALTAALTANSAASEWAFTDFQPGMVEIDGSDYELGKFTHFLLFEHRFPKNSDDDRLGMTAVLTALSSAINSTKSSAAAQAIGPPVDAAAAVDFGPVHDAETLRALARDLAEESGCSPNPLDYGRCVIAAAKAVWSWVEQWGHLILDILTLATFAPPPFTAIGVAASATNATWYAIEGDFGMAGLSLAAAVPGLAFGRIAKGASAAKGAEAAAIAEKSAAKSDTLAQAAKRWRPLRPWNDCDLVPVGGLRLRYRDDWSSAQRKAASAKVKAYYERAIKGQLVKTVPQRSGSTASATWRKATGKDVAAGQQVDHIIDLQLGGADEIANLKPLDRSVNASLGKQVEWQLRDLSTGDLVPFAAIC